MRINRIAALFLILATVLSASGCGFIDVRQLDVEPSGTHSAAHDKNTDEYRAAEPYLPADRALARLENAADKLAQLGDCNYGGKIVFVAESTDSPVFSSGNDTLIGRLDAARDALVGETLNVKIVKKTYSSADLFELGKRVKAAGEQTDDIYVIPSGQAAKYAVGRLLADLAEKDYDYGFIDGAMCELMSVTGGVFGIAGDASYSPDMFGAVYVNRTLTESAGISCDEIYDTVRSGEWTWDKLISYASQINGAGIATPSTEQTLFDLVYRSAGGTYLGLSGTTLSAVFTQDGLGEAKKICSSLGDAGIKTSSFSAAAEFSEGQTSFLIHRLAALPKIAETDADYAIVPVPKAAADGEYRTLMPREVPIMSIPNESREPDMAYSVILALNAATADVVYGGYTDALFTEYLRDASSAEMLELIFTTAEGEPAFALGAAYPEVAGATYSFAYKYGNADKKTYEKQYKSAIQAMNKAVAKVKKNIAKKK